MHFIKKEGVVWTFLELVSEKLMLAWVTLLSVNGMRFYFYFYFLLKLKQCFSHRGTGTNEQAVVMGKLLLRSHLTLFLVVRHTVNHKILMMHNTMVFLLFFFFFPWYWCQTYASSITSNQIYQPANKPYMDNLNCLKKIIKIKRQHV